MMTKNPPITIYLFAVLSILFCVYTTGNASEVETSPLSLQQVVQIALEANLEVKVSSKETEAAEFAKKESRAGFYPKLNATYQYKRNEEEISSPSVGWQRPIKKRSGRT